MVKERPGENRQEYRVSKEPNKPLIYIHLRHYSETC